MINSYLCPLKYVHLKELTYLNKYFVKYKWHFLLGIVFVSVSNYFRILQPQYIRDAMDLVVLKLKEIQDLQDENIKASYRTALSWTILTSSAAAFSSAKLAGVMAVPIS